MAPECLTARRALRGLVCLIRAVLQQDKGVSLAYTSIRHALGQLEARKAVEQDGGWRVALEAAPDDRRAPVQEIDGKRRSGADQPGARSPAMIAATLCRRSDQADYLHGEPGEGRPG
jgi:hypothetical protein